MFWYACYNVLDDEPFQQINCNQYCRDLLYSKSFYHNHIKLVSSSEPKIKYNINNKTYTKQIFNMMFIQRITTFALFFAAVADFSSVSAKNWTESSNETTVALDAPDVGVLPTIEFGASASLSVTIASITVVATTAAAIFGF